MIFARLILCLSLTIGTARAQDVVVRSGEHADFSRLVLEFPTSPDWKLGRVPLGYELVVEDEGIGFDTARAFELIPRQRITALSGAPGRLQIAVADNVHADAFEIRAGRLVIDIKDGPPDEKSRFEMAIDPPEEPDNRLAMFGGTNEPLFDSSAGLPDPPASLPAMALPLLPNDNAQPPPPASRAAEDALPLNLPDERPERVVAMERALLEQLGRAVGQGLIEPDLGETERRLARVNALTAPADAAEVPAAELPDLPQDPPPGDLSHVRVRTRVDLDNRAAQSATGLTDIGEACLPDDLVAVNDWGVPPDEGLEFSTYRAGLIGEFDTPASEPVTRLARYYIYLGFGAEAEATLTQFGLIPPDGDILRAMAQVMDDGQARDPGRLAGQAACDSDLALWAVIAVSRLAPGDPVNRPAVLRAFSALPLHLRRHLGPALSERFLVAGDTDTTEEIRNLILRAPGEPGEAMEMMDARLDLARGDTASAAAVFDDLVARDGPSAPEALLARIDLALAEGTVPPDDMISQAEAQAFERRGTPAGADLMRAALAGRIAGGDVAPALAAAHDPDSGLAPAARAVLLTKAYGWLSDQGDDVTFLREVLGQQGREDLEGLDTSVRRAAAARLITLGFAPEARALLNMATDVPEPGERLLLADVALAERKPQVAIGYLAGLETDDAKTLRARALAQARAHGSAADVYEQLNAPEMAAREAWRDGDWGRVARLGSAPEKAVADLVLEKNTAPDDGPAAGPLARNRRLIERSAEARGRLETLLESLPEP